MKLLFTITGYLPSIGGAQLHLHSLGRKLIEKHGIQVVCQWDQNRTDWLIGTTLRAPEQKKDYVLDGISIRRLGLSLQEKIRMSPWIALYYPWMTRALPYISRCLAEHIDPFAQQSDLVHNVRMGREALSYASFEIARRCGIPFVFSPLHHPRWVGWRYEAYLRLYRMADMVVALTDAERRTLEHLGVKEQRIFITGMGPVLHPTADASSFRSKHGLEGPIVLFLGQHYPYKGYRQLLRATSCVWQRAPETRFVFIGPAVGNSEREFRAVSDPRILRLGSVNLQEKTDALAACTLLCVPSTQESFGGIYTEAWSFAKPVIGCDIPAVAEVITDGVDGYLVRQEPAQIADRISDLILNTARSREMGAAGLKKVEERFTWERIAERTEEAYRKALVAS